ncbi:hypothetical protein Barb7_01046 [Bacteroidales bacterium Barb7]|nr:hypothetical protein Barb7_01046 [Bacteroidales bacterium Barb7]
MIRQEQIAEVIDYQGALFLDKNTGVERESLDTVPIVESYANIITGIRRCGKSTLLLQLLKKKYNDALFLNFEDIRLAGFETSDFSRLLNEIVRRKLKVIFLDEVQLVKAWEVFVNQLLREGYTVFVTSSNASLLSRELGTHLTGRHLSTELFPFSYKEFLRYKNGECNSLSLTEYLKTGGISEYVKTGVSTLLTVLTDDIIIRDIAIRHGIRDVNSLRQLTVYLLSNIGTLVSANKLSGMFGIKSNTTLLDYFSFLQDSYLMEFMPKFSYSLKTQARNPKKIYAIDTGIASEISSSFSDNTGHKLENLIYIHLRHRYKELRYFKEKGECDFVVLLNGKAIQLIQVCSQIDDLNFDREYNGLIEAMQFFSLPEGIIVTLNQKDIFEKNGLTVKLIPAHDYLSL